MMDELDTDRDGYVDLGEFAAFHARASGRGDGELEAELRAASDVYDVDGDGRITDSRPPSSARCLRRSGRAAAPRSASA